MGTRTRVVIVEDHTLFAESLELALSIGGYDVRRVAVPEQATSVASLLTQVLRAHPRIVLLDLDLGRLGDGVRLIGPLSQARIDVVVVTASLDLDRWGECLRHGARKVVPKAKPLNETLATVRRLSSGLPVLDREERSRLVERHLRTSEVRSRRRACLDRLTPRETEIMAHLMFGRTVQEIARLSVVSEATVRTQVKSILSKLEVSSQIAAVGLAHSINWIPPEV